MAGRHKISELMQKLEELKIAANALGLETDNGAAAAFIDFYHLVISYNEKVNLTSITDPLEFEIKHFVDSIAAAPYLSESAKIIDVGSGAGFPAVPLKILRPDLEVLMLDCLKKRVDFLDLVIKSLKLKNVAAVHARAEDAAKGALRESFDAALARAVGGLPTIMEYSAPYIKSGGKFIAYKTSADELIGSEAAAKELGLAFSAAPAYTLPDGSARTLFIFEKTAPTPKKYPRAGNKPKTQPIGKAAYTK